MAVIGCGLIGRKRVLALPSGARVVALADVDRSRAEALGQMLDYPVRVVATAEEALAETPDLAIVATVHASLAPISSMALAAGCHVLVEKPGGHRLDELVALRQAAA
ncbi:MAG TPA: Gfo/Idh/MocA family oxidoreductase, partial [Actinomycetota bacterium]|nr:Gfo/Idh/MocA family oxidoreductase [Actinomycetota bacterium]